VLELGKGAVEANVKGRKDEKKAKEEPESPEFKLNEKKSDEHQKVVNLKQFRNRDSSLKNVTKESEIRQNFGNKSKANEIARKKSPSAHRTKSGKKKVPGLNLTPKIDGNICK